MQEQTPENQTQQDLAQETQDVSQNDENMQDSQDLQSKYDELKDQYVRAFADFENTKKRLEREKYQSLEYANERFGIDLLPVLDTLQKALESAQAAEQQAIVQGLELTLESFYKVLSKHGIEHIPTDGEFDPNLHECLMQVPDPARQNGEIAQILQNGYTYKGRVLRPAMVSIVKND
ncbi:nucleotide exchange factor GrpE [uncultured Helicobacter sp.]|mgnify:CR=1 FL=1|uniref:nucleotide exchange factor GrpE n=1 Tax=uncultured Helicobacter sp. TaxID=175537 RepID=UPI001C3A3301|nr:nucleotide exchange factor GrpE [Candidatus Helicobacter avicola]